MVSVSGVLPHRGNKPQALPFGRAQSFHVAPYSGPAVTQDSIHFSGLFDSTGKDPKKEIKKWKITSGIAAGLAALALMFGGVFSGGSSSVSHDQRPTVATAPANKTFIDKDKVAVYLKAGQIKEGLYLPNTVNGTFLYELHLTDGSTVYYNEPPVSNAKDKLLTEQLKDAKIPVVEQMKLDNGKVIEKPTYKDQQYIDLKQGQDAVAKGQVQKAYYINDIRVAEPTYELDLYDGTTVYMERPSDAQQEADFQQSLAKADLTLVQKPADSAQSGNAATNILMSLLPILLMVGIFMYIGKKARGAGGAGGGMGAPDPAKKSGGYKVAPPETRFDDVRGYPMIVDELKDIVANFNRHRKSAVKTKPISGVLLYGPPGTGKTLMAKAIAGEAGVPFLKADASEFVEMFVGVGARRVRDLFAEARKHPNGAIIFIDEIDAIGRKRGGGHGGGSDSERETTLNQLLIELQGFTAKDNILVMAATNRLETLDDALVRSGRFDMKVPIPLPQRWQQRRDILDVHVKGQPLAEDVDLDAVAKMSKGFSGADLANMVNQAAINAARNNREKIGQEDFFESMLRVLIGQKDQDWDDERALQLVSHHEVVGHGLMAILMKMKVFMVAMVPRGNTGGLVMADPDETGGVLPSRKDLLKQVLLSAGGRAAEQAKYGEMGITPGASGDIQQIEQIFRQMMSTGMLDNQLHNLMSQYEPLAKDDKDMLSTLFDQAVKTSMEMIQIVPPEKRDELVRASLAVGRELIQDDAMKMYGDVLGDELQGYLDQAEKLIDQFALDPLAKNQNAQKPAAAPQNATAA